MAQLNLIQHSSTAYRDNGAGERPSQNISPPEAKKPRLTAKVDNGSGNGAPQSNGSADQRQAPAAPRRPASPDSPGDIYIPNGHGMANQSEYARNRPKRQVGAFFLISPMCHRELDNINHLTPFFLLKVKAERIPSMHALISLASSTLRMHLFMSLASRMLLQLCNTH